MNREIRLLVLASTTASLGTKSCNQHRTTT
uniref:Uncharacterized protein n=1 Tax=Arundo donax TaxID=35708 RepID=A0A0A9B585_ARUDO